MHDNGLSFGNDDVICEFAIWEDDGRRERDHVVALRLGNVYSCSRVDSFVSPGTWMWYEERTVRHVSRMGGCNRRTSWMTASRSGRSLLSSSYVGSSTGKELSSSARTRFWRLRFRQSSMKIHDRVAGRLRQDRWASSEQVK
jgi:hypothetical protein